MAQMPELATRLQALRAELVNTMASELEADGEWRNWIPLLGQVETAIRAVGAVMGEN